MPTPVSPNTGAPERVFAKDQPQYLPLTVACYETTDERRYLMRYTFSADERAAIAAGADIYLSMLHGVSPHLVEVGSQEWMLPHVLEPRRADELETTLLVLDNGARLIKLRPGENVNVWTFAKRDDATGALEVRFVGGVGVPERFVASIVEAGAFDAQGGGKLFTFTGVSLMSSELRAEKSMPDAIQLSYEKLVSRDL